MKSNLSGANWFRRWQYVTESYTRRRKDKNQLKRSQENKCQEKTGDYNENKISCNRTRL